MTTKTYFYPVLIAAVIISMTACKSKKMVAKPQEPTPVATTPPPTETKPVEQPTSKEEEPAPAPKPSLKFSNIQFEFNSGVLRTDAYPVLDQAAAAIKQYPDVKFMINGHSSAEGSTEHNQQLSEERANAVKTYLVNAGVSGDALTTKGYGESKPIAPNDTEAGRALNRRVEIKPIQ
ncbi:OmpA family protein [Mucilaginibacter sp. KACC 22063]|uniref:OmpA family protein n=1 Tax=Mucilaginibacter sp. KACC 22063 TaxID=3025666 RepID=UPI0023663777|nr:OmpA family protein [Mucilaginibacter sp. KACC 22063]WDF55227.1 OmpA family protein [Mucilaginibacter sp. KACC 22063]